MDEVVVATGFADVAGGVAGVAGGKGEDFRAGGDHGAAAHGADAVDVQFRDQPVARRRSGGGG